MQMTENYRWMQMALDWLINLNKVFFFFQSNFELVDYGIVPSSDNRLFWVELYMWCKSHSSYASSPLIHHLIFLKKTSHCLSFASAMHLLFNLHSISFIGGRYCSLSLFLSLLAASKNVGLIKLCKIFDQLINPIMNIMFSAY